MKKENRIKKNSEIASIVLKRQRASTAYFIIYYQPSTTIFRVAISVSKKYGNSVERNHAKRIIRETIRPNISTYSPMNVVVVVKNDLKNAKFAEVNAAMMHCLNKIEKTQKTIKQVKNNGGQK